jgi:hypothetical protein
MATGDGWTSQLIAGLAQYLEDGGAGVWRPDGSAYEAGEIAITDRDIPPEPDEVITLADYPVASTRGMQDVTVGVQLRIRGTTDPRVCRDIGDACFELLDGLAHAVFGDIRIVQMYRQSAGSLGKDAQDRWEASHNYYVEAMRLTANRTQ